MPQGCKQGHGTVCTGVPISLAPDTLAAVEAWLAAAGLTTGRVCRALTKGGRVRARLSADAVARLFTQMAQAAGLAPQLVQGIAGHSARVGRRPGHGRPRPRS